jgi:hypothetical protein
MKADCPTCLHFQDEPIAEAKGYCHSSDVDRIIYDFGARNCDGLFYVNRLAHCAEQIESECGCFATETKDECRWTCDLFPVMIYRASCEVGAGLVRYESPWGRYCPYCGRPITFASPLSPCGCFTVDAGDNGTRVKYERHK